MPACLSGSPTLGPSLVNRLSLNVPPYLGWPVVVVGLAVVIVVVGAVVVGLDVVVVGAVEVAGLVVVVVAVLHAARASIATNIVANMRNRPFFTVYPPELFYFVYRNAGQRKMRRIES